MPSQVANISLSVARLFTSAVLCFELVAVARGCTAEYETCQLRLDTARYRLSEWGSSTGLGERSHPDALFAYDDMKKKRIERILRQINRLFDRAREESRPGPHDLYEARDMSADAALLHKLLLGLAQDRSRVDDQPYNERDNLSRIILTEDKSYRKLVGDLIGLTDDLISFSSESSKDRQRRMCRDAIIYIESRDGDIKRLGDAVTKVYPDMAKNISKAVARGSAAALAADIPDQPDFLGQERAAEVAAASISTPSAPVASVGAT